ncbi:SCO family protein [Rhizobium sp. P38BS-XIX]|uniref:SCO family protein n=1 Tax=Rhizobium sp. P38BS-XIX TaxID=2726740 RepID=UPI001456E2A2|nr:SCO family protein [Rhizobium sp. P38BS-XIX]NLR97261.1 SCO family protein [Rhizobium sp. P38BS-XIX]
MTRLALLLVLILSGLVASPSAAAPFDPFKVTGIDQKPNVLIPLDRPFEDEAGHPVTLRALAGGKPMLLVPVLHNCPNICGVTLSGLMEAVEGQRFRPLGDFAIVAFGIDPKEGPKEAEESLHDLRLRFPDIAATGIHALTGKEADIHAVTDALGYRYAWDPDIGQYAHDAAVAVLTADGHLSRWLYGLAPEANDLKLALTEAGRGQTGDWSDQILLLCYHYDPVTGRYSSVIGLALRIAGGATIALGGGGVALALLRERRRTGLTTGSKSP